MSYYCYYNFGCVTDSDWNYKIDTKIHPEFKLFMVVFYSWKDDGTDFLRVIPTEILLISSLGYYLQELCHKFITDIKQWLWHCLSYFLQKFNTNIKHK